MPKKFIRTEDNVYEREKVEVVWNTGSVNKPNIPPIEEVEFRLNLDDYYYEPIIAEADTLEELCDLFIDEETKDIFHKHNGFVVNYRINYVYSFESLIKVFHSIKGAIYTDKGLMYVAKMNKDGELELI